MVSLRLSKYSGITLRSPNESTITSLKTLEAVSVILNNLRKRLRFTSFSLREICQMQRRFVSCTDMSATGTSLFLAGIDASNCDG